MGVRVHIPHIHTFICTNHYIVFTQAPTDINGGSLPCAAAVHEPKGYPTYANKATAQPVGEGRREWGGGGGGGTSSEEASVIIPRGAVPHPPKETNLAIGYGRLCFSLYYPLQYMLHIKLPTLDNNLLIKLYCTITYIPVHTYPYMRGWRKYIHIATS